jgi:hypothetical protein
MRTIGVLLLLAACTTLGAACATSSYALPEQERSRAYAKTFDQVWQAAVATVDQLHWSVSDRRQSDGVLTARTGFKMTSSMGYEIHILVTTKADSTIRVDVSAEQVARTQTMGDYGGSKARVREFIQALDDKLAGK